MHKDDVQDEYVSEDYVPFTPARQECMYTSCYCEENVWKLCEHVKNQNKGTFDHIYAVFISNERRMKSSRGGQPVVWDYHVILLHKSPTEQKALQSEEFIKPAFWRKMRVIPAEAYLKNFASDRIAYERYQWDLANASTSIPLYRNSRLKDEP
ncbi:hypothetical protein SKAU_G00401020 [Synaphobranchus kaupii]|uniref:Protein N-terminal glutamine amidohydrolase n=1 Tax=Synaphobranchus kaupii TaxID=118154 RepID=A0A9Q1E947_SYNKA|nr:hypothetical protein SKAU_G00401020 [Synaphobranchus kaupii]